MNAKERFYSGLAKETIGKITSNTDNWTSFLRTMSRNYEFTYPEQVMIYAQRPNATFCKPYEDWNAENYRRYVKRGSTGIALFVMNRDKPYLRYVFDVADTGVRRSSPELKPWEVTPENRSYVMEAMERTFGVAADGVLEAQLEDIACRYRGKEKRPLCQGSYRAGASASWQYAKDGCRNQRPGQIGGSSPLGCGLASV